MKKLMVILSFFSICLMAVNPSYGKGGKSQQDRYKNVDMSKVTCNDVQNEKDIQLVKAVLVWIDGYLSGKTGQTTVDVNQLLKLAEQLEGYCQENPSTTILDALKKKKRAKY